MAAGHRGSNESTVTRFVSACKLDYLPALSYVCPQRPQLITASPSLTPGTNSPPHARHLLPDALARVEGPAGLAANAISATPEPSNSPAAVPQPCNRAGA